VVPDERGRVLTNLVDFDEVVAKDASRHLITLEPYAYRWYRVGGLDYALRGG
jgi:maltose alpha-D-glucosyltransferase/alpha-amylase